MRFVFLTNRLDRIFLAFRGFQVAGLLLISMAVAAEEGDYYDLRYTFEMQPEEGNALVTLAVEDARLLSQLDFNIDPDLHSDIEANGELTVENGRAVWAPPEKNARLTLKAKIDHQRDPGEYDARITDNWAIFRGDDMVPPAAVRTKVGAQSRATLRFKLPSSWPSVNTGWERIDAQVFRIDNPSRRFDRPTGWMIAGKLGTRRDQLGNTRVSVSAPKGSTLHRMDVLTYVNFVWPEIERAFGQTPPKLLIVGAGNPMWRGGLSAPNSLFLHADRPLVSENGTSSLVHEVVHMVTGIQGRDKHDWIAEGIAEFYAVELIYRAGGMTEARREKVFADLANWGKDADTLIKRHSTGATTARATVLFDELDQEIRKTSEGQYSLDDVARRLMKAHRVSLEDLRGAVRELTGETPVLLKNV